MKTSSGQALKEIDRIDVDLPAVYRRKLSQRCPRIRTTEKNMPAIMPINAGVEAGRRSNDRRAAEIAFLENPAQASRCEFGLLLRSFPHSCN